MYEKFGSDVVLKSTYDLMKFGLLNIDNTPTYLMKALSGKPFDFYLCFLGEYFGCNPIEIYTIYYLF